MPDPNAVGRAAGPPVPAWGFYKFRSSCPRQMVSIGVRLERGSAAFHRALLPIFNNFVI